ARTIRTRAPCGLVTSTTKSPPPASTTSVVAAARALPRDVSATQAAPLPTRTSATASTAIATLPDSATAATSTIAIGASSATPAARRTRHDGRVRDPPSTVSLPASVSIRAPVLPAALPGERAGGRLDHEWAKLVLSTPDDAVACLWHFAPGAWQVADWLGDDQVRVIGQPADDFALGVQFPQRRHVV